MELLAAVLGVLAFTGCVSVALAVRLARAVRRRAWALRERAGLELRARSAGPAGEVARLRRDLAGSVASARRALAVSRSAGAPVGDVPALLCRLEAAAVGVDAELRLLEAQPDRGRVAAALPGPRERAGGLTRAAAALVDGLADAAGHAAAEVSSLQAACHLEADALRAARPAGVPGAVSPRTARA